MAIELLHERLKRLYSGKKNRSNLRAQRLAVAVDYSTQSVTYWKSGQRRIPRDAIAGLAKVFNMTPEEFLKDTIQCIGVKRLVNFSEISYYHVTELKEYPGLTLDEVRNVLQFREENPNF